MEGGNSKRNNRQPHSHMFFGWCSCPKVNRNAAWTLWGEDPTGSRAHEDYSDDYESTRCFNRIDAFVRWRRILPRWTDGRRRCVWSHFAYPSGPVSYRQPEQEITQDEVLTGRKRVTKKKKELLWTNSKSKATGTSPRAS